MLTRHLKPAIEHTCWAQACNSTSHGSLLLCKQVRSQPWDLIQTAADEPPAFTKSRKQSNKGSYVSFSSEREPRPYLGETRKQNCQEETCWWGRRHSLLNLFPLVLETFYFPQTSPVHGESPVLNANSFSDSTFPVITKTCNTFV